MSKFHVHVVAGEFFAADARTSTHALKPQQLLILQMELQAL